MPLKIDFQELQLKNASQSELPDDAFDRSWDVYSFLVDITIQVNDVDFGYTTEDHIGLLYSAGTLYEMVRSLPAGCETTGFWEMDCPKLTFSRNHSGKEVIVAKEGVEPTSICDFYELRQELLIFYHRVLRTLLQHYPQLRTNLVFDEHWFIAFGESTIRPNKALNRSGDGWPE